MNKFNKKSIVATLAISAMLSLFVPATLFAATAPVLGTNSTYGVVSTTYTGNVAATTITGDVCYTTGPGTFAPTIVGGTLTVPCTAGTNGTPQATALATINTQACTAIAPVGGALNTQIVGGNPAGTFPPGCYAVTGAMTITTGTTVTLDLTAPGGDGGNVWVFKSTGALTTGASTAGFPSVVLANGASASDVFWAPAAATTIGANFAASATPTFIGTIIDDAGISLGHFANLLGRALDYATTVTTDANIITVPTSLHVVKLVVNTGGGTAVASDFNVNVKLAGVDVSGSPAVGVVTPGRAYALAAGTYVVSETANPSYSTTFSGACDASGNVTLAVGDDATCTVINTFNIGGGTGGGSSFAILPLINLTKVPSPLSLPAGPGLVTYTYVSKNIGVVDMIGVWVKDDKCSDVKYVFGDINNNKILNVGEEWTYTCTKMVSATETNVATTHGQSSGWDVYDTANATVVVGAALVPPLIHLEKIPNVFSLPAKGGPVTYSYLVTNVGTVPMSDVTISDDKCTGLPARVEGHPGDLNKNNLLDTNETFYFTCQTNLTKTTTNTGTATGHANGFTSVDYSSATVVVSAPGLPNTGYGSEGGSTLLSLVISLVAIALSIVSLVAVFKRRTA